MKKSEKKEKREPKKKESKEKSLKVKKGFWGKVTGGRMK